jgi:glycosyltransferase involved in cell wall biosynthesis
MILPRRPLKVVATILARNEQDIIGANIEHHLAQGVWRFIVTDNSSTDGTRAVAARYPEVVEIIDEPDETHNQSASVTRMAQLACKMNPDWIIHLDADELWCGLSNLREINASEVGSTKVFLHPPTGHNFDLQKMRYYLDFEAIKQLPGECKVAHRPNPDIIITHGNHGFSGDVKVQYTKDLWRHHYPIRSYSQFERKTVDGHRALLRRNAICARWEKWYNLHLNGRLANFYDLAVAAWSGMVSLPNVEDLLTLLGLWSTEDVIYLFTKERCLPSVGEWPRS